jgi:tight adherence protein B
MLPEWTPYLSSLLVLAAVVIGWRAAGTAWDAVTQKHIADLMPLLDALSLDRKQMPVYLRWWGLALLASFVLVAIVLRMPPLSVAAVYFVYIAPRVILQYLIDRRRKILRDQLVGATVAMANACRAGLSLAQALETVSKEVSDPLATELGRIVRDYHHGRPLSDAIAETKERLQLDSFTLFASAILVSLERGGRVTEALERISESLQETQRLERKLDADTASGKSVVWILAAFPFLFLFGFFFLYREGTALVFQTLLGQFVLLVVIGIVYVAVRWSLRILAIEV